MPSIWITRSQPLAAQSAARLLERGYDAFAAPLLKVTLLSPAVDLPPAAHLIFTSRNGVRAFAGAIISRHFSCLCVGGASAEAARAAGFKAVTSVDGTADDVVAWAQKHISPETPLYHIAGNHPRGDIIERLRAFGFTQARRELFYRSEPVTHDPRPRQTVDDIILLYSPMAAQSLISLGLDMGAMQIISMSAAIDAQLGDVRCKSRIFAARPNEDALFTRLPPL